MYSTMVRDASVFNDNLGSFLFQYKLRVLFPAAFIVQQIVPVTYGSPILGAQILHIHKDEGKLALCCSKNIFEFTLLPLFFFTFLSLSPHHQH